MNTIDLLKKLVEIRTSSKDKANGSIEFLAGYLSRNDIAGKIIENNGYKSYVASIGKGSSTLVLNGHIDVVSGKDEQFKATLDGDKLYGRGAADMKGGVAAMVQAFLRLSKEDLDSRVMLQIVSDEESGGFNCSKYLVDNGYVGDFVICTEPTNMKLAIQSKGILNIDVISKGSSAHGSRPWEGENAILNGLDTYKKICELPILRRSSVLYESSSVNLAWIKGGDIYNRVPDSCSMGLDIRYVPELDSREIINDIESIVDGSVHLKEIENGMVTERSCKYLGKLSEAYVKVTGDKELEVIGQHGSSDGRFFSDIGIPAVEFGPIGKNWHGDDEYVSIKSVTDLENVIFEFGRDFR